MSENPHFETFASWDAARERVDFPLVVPHDTAGQRLSNLALFVRDHHMREVAPEEQSLEAHYGAFVLTQSRPGKAEALRAVRQVSYGPAPRRAEVGGHEARVYALGPEPASDDPDGRTPAVVAWAEGEHFYLLASDRLDAEALLVIAQSVS